MAHFWGDSWPHWKKLHEAINFIEDYWRKYGLIDTCMCKEKFGTFRDYAGFWPAYLYLINNKYLKSFLFFLSKYILPTRLIIKYQEFIYNRGIQLACLKYPEIKDEILSDLSRYDLIKKGPGTDFGGEELESQYWRK